MGHADPQAERAALARALARELGRRAFHGERGLAPPSPLEALPRRGSDAGDARTAPSAPPGTEQAVETSLATSPPATSQPESGRPARGPAESGREPGAMPPMPQGELTPAEVDDRRAAVAARAARAGSLDELRAAVADCTACGLCASRTQTVFMDGTGSRGVVFVGEAPGEQEDRTGVPFVGPAGQLLTDIVTKGMGLRREEVAIANVLKCRPPGNRDPRPEEKAICTPWLERQLELLGARVLIPLGKHASGHLLGTPDASMGSMRGRSHQRPDGTQVIPTYHPAYLLRNPGDKRLCWADIQVAMDAAGIPRPGR